MDKVGYGGIASGFYPDAEKIVNRQTGNLLEAVVATAIVFANIFLMKELN